MRGSNHCLLPERDWLFCNTRSFDISRGESNSIRTGLTPDSTMPRALAAARERSMTRPFGKRPAIIYPHFYRFSIFDGDLDGARSCTHEGDGEEG